MFFSFQFLGIGNQSNSILVLTFLSGEKLGVFEKKNIDDLGFGSTELKQASL